MRPTAPCTQERAHLCAFTHINVCIRTHLYASGESRPCSRLRSDHRVYSCLARINPGKARVYSRAYALLANRAPERRVPCQEGALSCPKRARKCGFRRTFLAFSSGLVPRSPHFVKVRKHACKRVFPRRARKHESTRRHP